MPNGRVYYVLVINGKTERGKRTARSISAVLIKLTVLVQQCLVPNGRVCDIIPSIRAHWCGTLAKLHKLE